MKSESSIYIDPEGENSAVELRQWFRLQGVETDPKIVPLQAEAMELAGRIAKLQTQKRILTETINEILAETDPVLGRKYWLRELEKRQSSARYDDGYEWDERFDHWATEEEEDWII